MKGRIYPSAKTGGKILSCLALDRGLLALQKLIFSNKFIRAVYYHDTTRADVQNLEQHFRFYAENFSSVSYDDFEGLLSDGKWHKEKPGLIISFDDGLRTNFDIGYPLLREYGFVGWFFVPTGFIESSSSGSEEWAASHSVVVRQRYPDGRVAMKWDELRELQRGGHVIGSHTHTHHRMLQTTGAQQIEDELVLSKRLLENALEREVTCFSWVGGEEGTYNPETMQRIQDVGYRYCFTTLLAPITPHSSPLSLHRTGVEALAPIEVVKLQLSGILDILLTAKRRRVSNALRSSCARV